MFCHQSPLFTLSGSAILLLLILLIPACEESGEPDPHQATIDEMQQRAASQAPRAEVNFGYIHHFDDTLDHRPSEPLVIAIDDARLELHHIALVTSALELHRCSVSNELTRRVGAWLIPTAHAHVPSSATRLGTPYVEDLLGTPESARIAGGIAPPFGTYCELHIILAPADDDVINLTAISHSEIENHTVLIRGRWRADENQPWSDFEWTEDRRQAVAVKLIDPQTGQSPLSLENAGDQTMVLVDKTLTRPASPAIQITDDGPQFKDFIDQLIETLTVYRYQ